MKINWNWGTKLFIAIVLFMSLIIGFVIVSLNNDVNLVEKDYYPKGQEYQQRLNEIKNASFKRDLFKLEQIDEGVLLNMPILNADTASIYFFRPSDNKKDIIFDISKADTMLLFGKSNFIRGKYLIKVYWNSDDVAYYFERDFFYE
ncbi:MAG: hypothetical protein C0598_04630 [Marinilabiliales bacterium]|nr:MAG: hypothetical protein C0598_04630 [Marinilabiliales bacterium]